MKKILISLFVIFVVPFSVRAVTMNSNSFQIESASINDATGNKSSTNYRLSDTLGQLAAGEFSSNGYIIKAGFQYLRIIVPFSFTVSNTRINFGQMIPDTPKTDTTNLIVSLGGARQYQVTAEELGPLRLIGQSSTIPNTACDGGVNTCTIARAKPWNSRSSYGFGYNMSGQDVPADFFDLTYYRPFPDQTASETSAVVMSNTTAEKRRQSTATFKLNVSNLQAPGSYRTIVNYVAIPGY